MYTHTKYRKLKKKYGSFSSWAIWNVDDQKDTSVIEKNITQLNTSYIFVGLNISRLLKSPPWSNFHGGRHDRKLMYACNDTKLRGSYFTDIFKDLPKSKASEVKKYLKENPAEIQKNVELFKQEMKDITVNDNTVFVVVGSDTSFLLEIFKTKFQGDIKDHKVFNIRHYSSRGKDEDWVNELWSRKEIGIDKIFKKSEWRKSKQSKA